MAMEYYENGKWMNNFPLSSHTVCVYVMSCLLYSSTRIIRGVKIYCPLCQYFEL